MTNQPQPQTHHIKMIPEPVKPTIIELYVFDPLDFIAESFLKFSFALFCIAVVVDIFENL